MTSHDPIAHRIKHKAELLSVVAFVVFSLAAPFLLGEMYPVTVSPMFCDRPTQCCTYRVFDDSGDELDPELFGLHLVYDGNPVGLGMGIKPKPTMHEFGEVPSIAEVQQHVLAVAAENSIDVGESIKVIQTVYRCDTGRPKASFNKQTIRFGEPTSP